MNRRQFVLFGSMLSTCLTMRNASIAAVIGNRPPVGVSLGYATISDEVLPLPHRTVDSAYHDDLQDIRRTKNLALDLRELVYFAVSSYAFERINETASLISESSPLRDHFLPYLTWCRNFRRDSNTGSPLLWTIHSESDPFDKQVRVIIVPSPSLPDADILDHYSDLQGLVFNASVLAQGRGKVERFERRAKHGATISDFLLHGNSRNVKSLALPAGPWTDDALTAEIVRLTQLRSLSLFRSDISDAGLKRLTDLGFLQVLNLDGCRITDDGVKELAKVKNLQSLSLNGCRMVTDASLKAFHKHPKLMEIRAAGTQITDAAVQDLHRATPNFHYAWLDDRNLPHDSKETPRFFDFTGKDKLK